MGSQAKMIIKIFQFLVLALFVAMGLMIFLIFVSPYIEPSVGTWQLIAQPKSVERGTYTQCIDADDFGYPKYDRLYSKPMKDSVIKHDNYYGETVSGSFDTSGIVGGDGYNQVTEWENTGFILTGQPLLVRSEHRWTSWFNGKFDANGATGQSFQYCQYRWATNSNVSATSTADLFYCPLLTDWSGINNSSVVNGVVVNQHREDPVFTNANDPTFATPCWFTHGYGSYMLIAPEKSNVNGLDNNGIASADAIRSPTFPTIHLFGYTIIEEDTTPTNGVYDHSYTLGDMYLSTLPDANLAGHEVWVRLRDRYYEDNAGYYIFKFKQGVRTADVGAIKQLIDITTDTLVGMGVDIYQALVVDSSFQRIASIAIVLYVVLQALSFYTGHSKFGQAELIVHLIKAGVVFELISPNSWDFFYTYVFQVFLQGTNDIVCMMVGNITTGGHAGCIPGEHGAPRFFDDMLSVFFAGETWAKVSSVALYGGGGGFIIFASFIVAICLFVMTLLWVVVVYLIGVIPMTLMILISPIFFVLMLFKSTNRLFQNWVKEFLSHSLQAILAMAALALFATFIIEYLQRTVGYRVCWKCVACWEVDLTDNICLVIQVLSFGAFTPTEEACKFWPLGFKTGSYPTGMKFWKPDIRWTPDTLNVCLDSADQLMKESIIAGFKCLDDPNINGTGAPDFYMGNQDQYDTLPKYVGHMGYMYLDWTDRADLDFVYRNPIDLPYYDPLDVSPNSPNGYIALKERLNSSEIVPFTTALIFILVIYTFNVFIKTIPSIAQEIADARFGINLGSFANTYTNNLLYKGAQIGKYRIPGVLTAARAVVSAPSGYLGAKAYDSSGRTLNYLTSSRFTDAALKLDREDLEKQYSKAQEQLAHAKYNLELKAAQNKIHSIKTSMLADDISNEISEYKKLSYAQRQDLNGDLRSSIKQSRATQIEQYQGIADNYSAGKLTIDGMNAAVKDMRSNLVHESASSLLEKYKMENNADLVNVVRAQLASTLMSDSGFNRDLGSSLASIQNTGNQSGSNPEITSFQGNAIARTERQVAAQEFETARGIQVNADQKRLHNLHDTISGLEHSQQPLTFEQTQQLNEARNNFAKLQKDIFAKEQYKVSVEDNNVAGKKLSLSEAEKQHQVEIDKITTSNAAEKRKTEQKQAQIALQQANLKQHIYHKNQELRLASSADKDRIRAELEHLRTQHDNLND